MSVRANASPPPPPQTYAGFKLVMAIFWIMILETPERRNPLPLIVAPFLPINVLSDRIQMALKAAASMLTS